MTAAPDERVKCRCGSSTYLVPGYAESRTCAQCGYLTSYCRCKDRDGENSPAKSGLPSFGDKARGLVGGSIVTALAAMFCISFISSPFEAMFVFGEPLGLVTAFFLEWLRDGRTSRSASAEIAVKPGTAEANPLTL